MTEFVLVRHGETDWNLAGRLQGTTDTPLNDRGREQAREAAVELRGIAWDLVVSSPLQRAYETAVIIVRELGMDESSITTHPQLHERRYGRVEGLTIAERTALYPDNIWPESESTADLNARAGAAMHQLANIHAGKHILIVAHGGWIRAALRVVSGFDKRVTDIAIPNASRTCLSHDGTRWIVGDVAVDRHPELERSEQ